MNATTWISLASALLGAVVALGVAMLTQREANKRARQERAEDRQQEQLRWAREDSARTYEQRRDAYLEFIRVCGLHEEMYQELEEVENRRGPTESEDLKGLYYSRDAVALFGTRAAKQAADEVVDEFNSRFFRGEGAHYEPFDKFQEVVRRDLGVTDEVAPPKALPS